MRLTRMMIPKRLTWTLLCSAGIVPLLPSHGVAAAAPIPDYVIAAVGDASRPDADRVRDAGRKPEQVIAFAGIEPGDKVADLMPGGGYFTRILCKLVGEAGHVYAISVARAISSATPPVLTHSCTNVTMITLQPARRKAPELWSGSDDPGEVYEYWSSAPAAENFAAPEPLDVIWTAENYHDLHNESFGPANMHVVNRALLAALRPGGILIVEDHAAAVGSGSRDTQSLHRIDIEQVKKEVTAAGFAYVGASNVLSNADDPRTVKAHELHDATDRLLLKFRKPE